MGVLWLVWKNKRVVHLLPSEPDKRLGAPHGASQSRPVNYLSLIHIFIKDRKDGYDLARK